MAAAEKKNLSGTTLNSSNSFAALDDDDIIARALEMGISQDSFPSEKVNYLKDLEIARHSINEMQGKSEDIPVAQTAPQILLLGLSDNGDDDMEDYTPVVSRRSKKKKKSADRKSLRGTLAKSGVASGGAHSRSSDASVKSLNDHPLCGIMAGTRRRKQNPGYL
jgi:hypothetical protein